MSARAKQKPQRAKGQSRASETPAERPSARSTAVTRKRASKAKRNRAAEQRAARERASTASSDVERSAIAVTLPPSAERSAFGPDGKQICWWFATATSTPAEASGDVDVTPATRRQRPSHAQFRELDSLVRLDRAQSGAGREVALIGRATLRALREHGWVFVSIVGFAFITQEGERAYLRERSRRYWRALDRSQTILSGLWGAA